MARQTKRPAKKISTGRSITKRQAERYRAKLLETLSEGYSITRAIKEAGICRTTAYAWRKKDSDFAEAWDRAIEAGTDALEDEARRRAHDGVDEPVFYKGEVVGHITRYSDTLIMFLLNGRRPEKFKRQPKYISSHVDGMDDVEVTIKIGSSLDG